MRDLALAIVDLARRAHGKATVRLYEEPWEFCIERFGPAACLSVYRAGPDPTIAVYDRAVTFDGLVGSVRDAIDALLADHQTKLGMRLELTAAADQLRGISASAPTDETRLPEPVVVVVEPDRDSPISFGAEFALRPSTDYRDSISSLAGRPESVAGDATEPLERSDMHALLFRGRVRAERYAGNPWISANAIPFYSPSASSSSPGERSTLGNEACPFTRAARLRAW